MNNNLGTVVNSISEASKPQAENKGANGCIGLLATRSVSVRATCLPGPKGRGRQGDLTTRIAKTKKKEIEIAETPSMPTAVAVDSMSILEMKSILNRKVDKTVAVSGHPLSSDVILSKADIGLDKIDNTCDLEKPVSSFVQLELNKKVDKTTTIAGHTLTESVIELSKQDVGLSNVDNTSDINKPISSLMQSALDMKVSKLLTVAGHSLTSDVILQKADVGLGQVDNTRDIDKQVSLPVQIELDKKVSKNCGICGYTFDHCENITLSKKDVGLSNVDDTNDLCKPISLATQRALDQKVDITTSINNRPLVSSIMLNKSDIGLPNVDDTSDAEKRVSIATQQALDLKVDKVISINGKCLVSNVTLCKSDMGLDQVDNTSDIGKPISIAVQNALNSKVDKAVTINGQALSTAIRLSKIDVGLDKVDNTCDIDKPLSSAAQSELNHKVDKSLTINGYSLNSNIVLYKSDIGLDRIDNTNDTEKPVSRAQQVALDFKVDKSLCINGKQLTSNIQISKEDVELANVDNTSDVNKPASKEVLYLLSTKADKFVTINGHEISSNVCLYKQDIGLSNVDNTSDIEKPVSRAQQAALDLKVDKTCMIAGRSITSNIILSKSDVLLDNVDNTCDLAKPVSTAQQAALDLKVDKSVTIAGHPLSCSSIIINKSDVGLGSVDNTSDANKPVSTCQQNALSLKVDKSTTVNGYTLSGNISLGKCDIGLSNVDNTTDMNKPVSIATLSKLGLKVDKSTTVNGYALSSNIVMSKDDLSLSNVDNTSDENKPISKAQQIGIDSRQKLIQYSASDEASMLSLCALSTNDIIKRTDLDNALYQYIGGGTNLLTNWRALGRSAGVVLSCSVNLTSSNGTYFIDTSSKSVQIGLPASPANQSQIVFMDLKSTWNINPLIVAAQGQDTLNTYSGIKVSGYESPVICVYMNGNWSLSMSHSHLPRMSSSTPFDWYSSKIEYERFVRNENNNVINAYQTPTIKPLRLTEGSLYSPCNDSLYFPNQGMCLSCASFKMDELSDYPEISDVAMNSVYHPLLRRIYLIPTQVISKWYYIDITSNSYISFTPPNGVIHNGYSGGQWCPNLQIILLVPSLQLRSHILHYIDSNGSLQSYTNNMVTDLDYHYSNSCFDPFNNRVWMVISSIPNNIVHYIDCQTLPPQIGTTSIDIAIKADYNFKDAFYVLNLNRIYFTPNLAFTQWMYIDCFTCKFVAYCPGARLLPNAYIGGVYSLLQNRIYLIPAKNFNDFNWHYIDGLTGKLIDYPRPISLSNENQITGFYSPKSRNMIWISTDQLQSYFTYFDFHDHIAFR